MVVELTNEAAQGFDHYRDLGDLCRDDALALCPYLNTSASAMAWHLGRQFAKDAIERPGSIFKIFMSHGNTIRMDKTERKSVSAVLFRWKPNNTFERLAA